jgi:SAM-dependent methyltransferase
MRNFYLLLEKKVPRNIKNLIPVSWRIWLGYKIKHGWQPLPRSIASATTATALLDKLSAPLKLPEGQSIESISNYLSGFQIEGEESKDVLTVYLTEALRRFLYTLQLIPDQEGRLLEIGANPYFLSLLLHRFRRYELAYLNYFGSHFGDTASQAMISPTERVQFEFYHVNIEDNRIPLPENSHDVVLLCEVLEHFTTDPMHALLEIKRVLKPGGYLILTTPNINRLENVARMISGTNIYDPYSGYGPHGRHNREYNRHELTLLLEHLGFEIEDSFTSDVHHNYTSSFSDPTQFMHLLEHRKADLGHYLFVRARSRKPANTKKPTWLYRSYLPHEMAD